MIQVSGPTNESEALLWAQEAICAGRYIIDAHFSRRCLQRKVSFADAKRAILKATNCQSYVPNRSSLAGGTSWRITGPDYEEQDTSVGIEAFQDHLGRRIILITIF